MNDTIQQLQDALVEADKAGDIEGATKLANELENQIKSAPPMDVARGVVRHGVEEFFDGVNKFGEDPVGTTKQAGIDFYETVKSFGNALVEESPEIAAGIGGELATKTPMLKPVPPIVGEVAGVTGAKMIDKGKPLGQAVYEASTEALVGRAIAKVGDRARRMRIAQKALPSSPKIKTSKERLNDNLITKESLLGNTKNVKDAGVQQIGARLPVIVETGGKANNKQIRTLVGAVSDSASANSQDSYYFKLVDDVEKGLDKDFLKGTKVPTGLGDTTKKALSEFVSKRVAKRTKAFDEATKIAYNSREILDVSGLLSGIDDFLSPQVGVPNKATLGVPNKGKKAIGVANKAAVEVKTAIDGIIRNKQGLLKQNLFLKEYATLKQALRDVSKFSLTKDIQDEVGGVAGRIKSKILDPYEEGLLRVGQASEKAGKDTLAFLQIMDNVRGLSEEISSITGTKVSGQIGISDVKQFKKAIYDSDVLTKAFSNPQSYRTAEKVLNEVNPALVKSLESGLKRRIYAEVMKKGLSSNSINSVIGVAGKPTAIGELLVEKFPELVTSLENTAILSEAIEEFSKKAIIRLGTEDTLKKDLGQGIYTAATGAFTGHALREKSGMASAAGNTIKAVFRLLGGDAGVYSDKKVIDMLSNAEGERLYTKSLQTFVSSPEAYDVWRQFATSIGRGITSDEFEIIRQTSDLPEDLTVGDLIMVGGKPAETLEKVLENEQESPKEPIN